MKLRLRQISYGVAFAALSLNALSAAPRVVDCDKPVKSMKRGVCANKLDRQDFMALSPGVSWWYSWYFKDNDKAPAEAGMEFFPMAWGDRKEDVEGLERYLATNKPRVVLAINEPNLKDQAFIPPAQTAELYKKVKAITDKYKLPLVGPHMALGSPDNASITAVDPITNKKTTYTFMTPFLKAVYHYLGDTEVPAVAAHSYGNFGELKWMVEMLHQEFQRPVWVTEFAEWNARDEAAEREYLIQSVDLMERAPYVEGYAWFKERAKDHTRISLLAPEPGKLTKLGETYVNMPVHDPEIFYRLPGKLQSESYVAMQKADIASTKDAEGFLEMQVGGGESWIDYNVAAPAAGKMKVSARLMSLPGNKIEIYSKSGTLLTTLETKEKGWQDAAGEIVLENGMQTLRVKTSGAARLNWIQFQ